MSIEEVLQQYKEDRHFTGVISYYKNGARFRMKGPKTKKVRVNPRVFKKNPNVLA